MLDMEINLPKGFTVNPNIKSSADFPNYVVLHKEFRHGKLEETGVAYFNTETKIARPYHGYFPIHPTGIKMGKFFKSIGYEWDAS